MPVNPEVQRDIINVLKRVKEFIADRDSRQILKWSDHIIHSASIYQDEYTLTLAVVVYSLGKLMDMKEFRQDETPFDKFCLGCDTGIDAAISAAEKEDWKAYMKTLKAMTKTISRANKNYSTHLQYVLNAAKIKKGSKMFLHGISIGRVAEALGISKWELIEYIGQTKETEMHKIKHGELRHKFKTAKEAFE